MILIHTIDHFEIDNLIQHVARQHLRTVLMRSQSHCEIVKVVSSLDHLLEKFKNLLLHLVY